MDDNVLTFVQLYRVSGPSNLAALSESTLVLLCGLILVTVYILGGRKGEAERSE